MFLFGNKDGVKGNISSKTFAWDDVHKGENVIYRYPRNIQWNDNVVVREDECAIFFRDGKAMHIFDRPGRYAMTTLNVPILGKLGSKILGVKQLGELYFVQKRELRGKFGTHEPLAFRDTEFGLVRLRAFGKFSYIVDNPLLFISKFVGTEGITSSNKIIDWLKSEIVQSLNDGLGKLKRDKKMAIVDIPAYLDEIEQVILTKLSGNINQYGLKVINIAGLNINLPPEVVAAIDKSGSMKALNVNYMQYQTGKAIEGIGKGAEKGGDGGAGTFAGLGAGIGAGAEMSKAIAQGMNQQPSYTKENNIQKIKCPKCKTENNIGSKFCNECGEKLAIQCKKCGKIVPYARFCSECGEKIE